MNYSHYHKQAFWGRLQLKDKKTQVLAKFMKRATKTNPKKEEKQSKIQFLGRMAKNLNNH